MNILLLFPHFNSPRLSSSLRSWEIGIYLAKNHEVTVFAPGVNMRTGELFSELRSKLYHKSYVHNVKLIRTRTLTKFRKSALKRLLFEFIYALLVFARTLFIRKIDIIVVSSPPAILPVFGLMIGKIKKIPVVFEFRDLMAEFLLVTKYIKSNLFIKLALKIENFVAERSDHIITVSPGIKRVLIKRGVPKEKITTVSNGYENRIFSRADYSFNARQQFSWGEKFVVVYAGGLSQIYDIPRYLRIAEKIKNEKDILFAIIGEGSRKNEYTQYCEKNDLTNVQFLGAKPRIQMPAILSQADLGIFFTKKESIWEVMFCNKTFDYLGSGIPMLYAGAGDIAHLLEKAKAGLVVEPGSDKAIIEAIIWAKSNPEKIKAMGKRGRDYVKTHYSRDKLSKKFEKVLIKIAQKYN